MWLITHHVVVVVPLSNVLVLCLWTHSERLMRSVCTVPFLVSAVITLKSIPLHRIQYGPN